MITCWVKSSSLTHFIFLFCPKHSGEKMSKLKNQMILHKDPHFQCLLKTHMILPHGSTRKQELDEVKLWHLLLAQQSDFSVVTFLSHYGFRVFFSVICPNLSWEGAGVEYLNLKASLHGCFPKVQFWSCHILLLKTFTSLLIGIVSSNSSS